MLETARVDRWTWAVRLYKTRSLAAAARESGHVTVNGATVKPSAKVRVGDRVEARVGQWHRVVEVARVIETRVGAAVAADCVIDRSPPPPEREQPLGVPTRERGSGRPTKRDRRVLDQLRGENDELHRNLKVRAAQEGVSLSDLALAELRRTAERPSRTELLDRISGRPIKLTRQTPTAALRAERDQR